MVDHLADLESDFSVFHGINDPWSMPGPEFFRKATRLGAYDGMMTIRIEQQRKKSDPIPRGQSTPDEVKTVSLNHMQALHPDLIERSPRE